MIGSLERFGRVLPAMLRDVSPSDACWKPGDGAWSILEIVCHLVDEEQYDFRPRIESTLADPERAWVPIDPEGWAVERKYNERDLNEMAATFHALREGSVKWLRSLPNPDWQRTHVHPQFGPFSAGDLFAAWVAHDCLHLRQLAKRLYEIAGRDAGEHSTRYAGSW
jgi:hypothetical protein